MVLLDTDRGIYYSNEVGINRTTCNNSTSSSTYQKTADNNGIRFSRNSKSNNDSGKNGSEEKRMHWS